MKLGASFSHPHIEHLGIDPMDALKEFESLGLKWIRLGCYWRDIEEKKGKYNFEGTEKLIRFCDKNDIDVVIAIGMKAPRYPEYYIPDYIKLNVQKQIVDDKEVEERVLTFIKKCVETFANYNCVKVWQVENEPLDQSGPNSWKIDEKILKKEVNLVRKLDSSRKILINVWGNDLSERGVYKNVLSLADIVGLDLYTKHEFSVNGKFEKYIGPNDSVSKIKEIAKEISQNTELWITELQAEPWEPDIVSDKDNPPSFLPSSFEENMEYGVKLSPDVILLWGFEYWLYRKKKFNDERYWSEAIKAIKKYS